jgi:hypothetical protein
VADRLVPVPGVLARLSAIGAAAQASLAGAYAWLVTVAPLAWRPGAALPTRVGAATGLAALVVGAMSERRWGARSRLASFWVFVLSSALAWSADPTGLAPSRVDGARGVAGMLGWALFALASAAPAIDWAPAPGRVVEDGAMSERRRLASGDAAYLLVGACLAAALQVYGWTIARAERALVVRLVGIAAGLAFIGAASEVALARHTPRLPPTRAARIRMVVTTLVLLGLLVVSAVLFGPRG